MTARNYVYLDKHGVYRVVGQPRMPLDGIVIAFREGDSPESIRSQWPFLTLEEVYGCITFYLANKQEIDEYLKRQEALFDKLKAEADANPSPVALRMRKIMEEQKAGTK